MATPTPTTTTPTREAIYAHEAAAGGHFTRAVSPAILEHRIQILERELKTERTNHEQTTRLLAAADQRADKLSTEAAEIRSKADELQTRIFDLLAETGRLTI